MTDAWGDLSRTHHCGQLRIEDRGREVVLAGWMHSRRDHGGVIFIDLRDRHGLTQVVARDDADVLAVTKVLRPECVVAVCGAPGAGGVAWRLTRRPHSRTPVSDNRTLSLSSGWFW